MRDIFDKITLGNLNLKNRLVRSATWEGIAGPDGGIDERSYNLTTSWPPVAAGPSLQALPALRQTTATSTA